MLKCSKCGVSWSEDNPYIWQTDEAYLASALKVDLKTAQKILGREKLSLKDKVKKLLFGEIYR